MNVRCSAAAITPRFTPCLPCWRSAALVLVAALGSLMPLWAADRANAQGVERLLVLERFIWAPDDADALIGYATAELYRQSVLLHARRRGWVTRDAALDEPLPEARTTLRLALAGHQPNGQMGVIRIRVQGGANPGETAFALPPELNANLLTTNWETARFLEEGLAEGGAFAAHLDGLGFASSSGRSRPAARPAPRRNAVDPMAILGEWGIGELLSHARELHQLEVGAAGSVEHALGLALTYAKLGKLTEWATSPLHQVFKARARLYTAQVVRTGTAQQSAVARAWLFALEMAMGPCRAALTDLRAADGAEFGWLPALEAFVDWRDDQLERAARADASDRISPVLAVFLVELSDDAVGLVRLGELALDRSPGNSRVLSAMGYAAGPFVRGAMGRLQLERSQADIQVYIAKLGLPNRGPVAALGRPRAAEQGVDLEWQRKSLDLLAALAADAGAATAFVDLGLAFHTYREWAFTGAHGVISGTAGTVGANRAPVDRYLPLLAGHPWVSALRLTTGEAVVSPELRRRYLAECRFEADLSMGASILFANLLRNQELLPATPVAAQILMSDARDALWDVAALGRMIAMDKSFGRQVSERRTGSAEMLLKGSPNNPWAIIALLDGGTRVVPNERLDQWIADLSHLRPLRRAFGHALVERKRFDDAEPLLRQSIEDSPDPETLKKLAEVYRRQKDDDRWVATMERILSVPGIGLEAHAAQRDIASHYLDRGMVDQALVHARGAAGSGAGWAFLFAMLTHEIAGDMATAEEFARRTSLSYGGSHWLLFCLRTGQGDLAAAQAQVENQRANALDSLDAVAGGGFTAFHLQRYAEAAEGFEQYVRQAPQNVVVEPFLCALWMIAAHQTGDQASFDRALEALRNRAHTRGRTLGKNIKQLAELFATTIAAGPQAVMSEQAFRNCLRAIEAKDIPTFHALAGAFYEARGQTEEARAHYLAGWTHVPLHKLDIAANSPTLCAAGLRRTGGHPYPVRVGR